MADDGRPLRSVVIAGGGTAGWMTAAALATLLPDLVITLVESAAIGTVGVGEATIPAIRHFTALVGIDDAALIAECEATYKLGIAFAGWHGADYLHPFGSFGEPLGGIDFVQLWLRATAAGDAAPLDAYSANTRAAVEGRAGAPLTSAFHFDATLFAALLRRIAEARGVSRVEGTIAAADRSGEDVAALILADGRRIEGDLFVDCTGFRSLLLGDALGVPFVDWQPWLPCDRAIALPTERTRAPVPYTLSAAHAAGWCWRIPLQHRTGNGIVYAGAAMTDDEAERTLRAQVEGEPRGDVRPLRFRAGHRAAMWVGNVVGIGLAAGFLEPLESTSIHLIQSALARLANALPARLPSPAAAAQFNRTSIREYELIRDFLVLHYAANDRPEPFWRERAAVPLPASLAGRIALWRETGQIVREPDELFSEASWVAVLLGQGIVPRGRSALAERVPPPILAAHLQRSASRAAQLAATLPRHEDALRRAVSAAARAL